MKTSTNVNPLITNFIVPQKPVTVSADDVKIIYDAQNDITLYMGGNSRPSRSNDGYKQTKHDYGNGTVQFDNDAERYTDD